MRRAKHIAALLMSLVGLLGCRDEPPEACYVKIRGHRWFVDLATTVDTRYTGLSGRRNLPADVGMLFVYPKPKVLAFCMRDCHIPIDIAFLDAQRRVIRMYTMEVEPDRAGRVTYSSQAPAQYALEVAGGALQGAGVRIGDRVKLSPQIPPATKAQEGP